MDFLKQKTNPSGSFSFNSQPEANSLKFVMENAHAPAEGPAGVLQLASDFFGALRPYGFIGDITVFFVGFCMILPSLFVSHYMCPYPCHHDQFVSEGWCYFWLHALLLWKPLL